MVRLPRVSVLGRERRVRGTLDPHRIRGRVPILTLRPQLIGILLFAIVHASSGDGYAFVRV
jgi:hypothetical protein